MMRSGLVEARQRLELEAVDLVDLSATPWRRVMLSARENIWCLVDAIDFPWISRHVWNVWHAGGRGSDAHWQLYAKRNVGRDRATVRLHREILIAADPRDDDFLVTHVADHINGQTLDNRRANLRWITKAENNRNRYGAGIAPTLDEIVRNLIAGLNDRPQLQEIPF